MTGGYIFSMSTLAGGGYPILGLGRGVPHLRSGGVTLSQVWGYPIQVYMVGVGGYPSPVLMAGGTPSRSGWWGVLHPGLDGGDNHIQVLMVGGTPWLGLDGGGTQGTPHHHQDLARVPPTLGLDGGVVPPTIKTLLGYPHPGMRYPPPSRPGWGTPLGWGTLPPARPGLGTPPPWDGVPPTNLGWGTPPPSRPGWGTPPPWDGVPPTLGWGTPSPTRQSSIASTCYAAGGMPLAFTQEDFLVFCFCSLFHFS